MQTNMAYYNILLKDVIALDHKQAVNYLDRRGSIIHYLIGIHKVFDGKTRTKINKTLKNYIIGTYVRSYSVPVCLIPLIKK